MINTDKIERFDGPDGERLSNAEMIDMIVAKTGVTIDQAQEALDKNNHDLIDAMIYVERTYGQASRPNTAASDTNASANTSANAPRPDFNFNEQKAAPSHDRFSETASRIGRYLLSNSLTICHNGSELTSIPLIICIAALLASFSTVLVVMVISLFFGVTYRISGPDFSKSSLNILLGSFSGMVRNIKNAFTSDKY